MRNVKCVDTGEVISQDQAFKVTSKNRNIYYSSEEAYKYAQKEKDFLKKCTETFWGFMNYDSTEKVPTVFFKKLQDWHRGYTYEMIYEAMIYSIEPIQWANNNKEFANETGRTQYLCSIIQNHLGDAKKTIIQKKLAASTKQYDYTCEDIKNESQNLHVDISRFLAEV